MLLQRNNDRVIRFHMISYIVAAVMDIEILALSFMNKTRTSSAPNKEGTFFSCCFEAKVKFSLKCFILKSVFALLIMTGVTVTCHFPFAMPFICILGISYSWISMYPTFDKRLLNQLIINMQLKCSFSGGSPLLSQQCQKQRLLDAVLKINLSFMAFMTFVNWSGLVYLDSLYSFLSLFCCLSALPTNRFNCCLFFFNFFFVALIYLFFLFARPASFISCNLHNFSDWCLILSLNFFWACVFYEVLPDKSS